MNDTKPSQQRQNCRGFRRRVYKDKCEHDIELVKEESPAASVEEVLSKPA